jgi:hypothetical protein
LLDRAGYRQLDQPIQQEALIVNINIRDHKASRPGDEDLAQVLPPSSGGDPLSSARSTQASSRSWLTSLRFSTSIRVETHKPACHGGESCLGRGPETRTTQDSQKVVYLSLVTSETVRRRVLHHHRRETNSTTIFRAADTIRGPEG